MRRFYTTSQTDNNKRIAWYSACEKAADIIKEQIPDYYRSRTFSGIIGDIKALSPKKALSLLTRKKGLGLQYAWLYLTEGIDSGYGFQACTSEVLSAHLAGTSLLDGQILDVGCAVGVSGGVLGLPMVYGFDLFPDILKAARLTDSLTGAGNHYTTADMTKTWPFRQAFDTVIAGLVCHHLKEQDSIQTFFGEANRVLNPDGSLVITLPAGSIAYCSQLHELVKALSSYGFETDRDLSGILISTDSAHSLFWGFVIVLRKQANSGNSVFIGEKFGFHTFRTPVPRTVKADKARQTAVSRRKVRHNRFVFIDIDDLCEIAGNKVLTFDTVGKFIGDN